MTLLPAQHALEEVVVVGAGTQKREAFVGGVVMNRTPAVRDYFQPGYPRDPYNTEDYTPVDENRFRQVKNQPLSTFSIDVDEASYSTVRRFLEQGRSEENTSELPSLMRISYAVFCLKTKKKN